MDKYWQLYEDKYGAIWKRIDNFYVKRLEDGMIGGWFNGEGLYPTHKKTFNR